MARARFVGVEVTAALQPCLQQRFLLEMDGLLAGRDQRAELARREVNTQLSQWLEQQRLSDLRAGGLVQDEAAQLWAKWTPPIRVGSWPIRGTPRA